MNESDLRVYEKFLTGAVLSDYNIGEQIPEMNLGSIRHSRKKLLDAGWIEIALKKVPEHGDRSISFYKVCNRSHSKDCEPVRRDVPEVTSEIQHKKDIKETLRLVCESLQKVQLVLNDVLKQM